MTNKTKQEKSAFLPYVNLEGPGKSIPGPLVVAESEKKRNDHVKR